jgi:hypothetical protein
MQGPDWVAWHRPYDDPSSPLSARLAVVQARIRSCLDALGPGPVRVLSLCGGEGRDLCGALAGDPRAAEVRGRLVELDPVLAATARAGLDRAGLGAVEVLEADAGLSDASLGAIPADLLLFCGVLGNVADDQLADCVAALPSLVRPGGYLVWTRHRRPPDRTGEVRRALAGAGITECSFDAPDPYVFTVGTGRRDGPARHLGAWVSIRN